MDCREAAEEDSTARDIRIAKGPITGPARAAKMFSWISSLPIPSPWSETPENVSTARAMVM